MAIDDQHGIIAGQACVNRLGQPGVMRPIVGFQEGHALRRAERLTKGNPSACAGVDATHSASGHGLLVIIKEPFRIDHQAADAEDDGGGDVLVQGEQLVCKQVGHPEKLPVKFDIG